MVSQPDRPGHRLKLTPPAVKVAAGKLGLKVIQPERIREPGSIDEIALARPELIVVVAYGQIIPRSILELAPRGVINVHGSLLPAHRGAAPVAHSLLAGDSVTGVTIMQMDEQLDHGPILTARELPIGREDDAAVLTNRLALAGAELLVETIGRLDQITPREQDHSLATLAPKLSRADGDLSWELPAVEIDLRVRAFRPWPGVTLPFSGSRIKVLRGGVGSGSGRAGEVLGLDGEGVLVAAGMGAFRLDEVQIPGRRPMAARLLVASGG